MMAYTNHGVTTSAKRNSGQKQKLSERDCCTLKRTTAAKVTGELHIHFKEHFHKTV